MSIGDKAIRHEKWRALVEEQEKSGLSQIEFCKLQNIVLSQFVYYRGQIKAKERSDNSNSESFVPVQINQHSPHSSLEVRLVLPNGFQCYFPYHLDVAHIKKFIEVLLPC
jgi:hypothetical protein